MRDLQHLSPERFPLRAPTAFGTLTETLGGALHRYLISLRWRGSARTHAVGEVFSLGAHATSTLWVPEEALVLGDEHAGAPEYVFSVVADDGAPRLCVEGIDVGQEWTHGEVVLSISNLPANLRLDGDSTLLGSSVAVRRLRHDIRLTAPFDLPVLIHGETGTGKELIARSLHEHSTRRDKPYVVIDCSAVPETIFESELFGHAKGSFSGATSNRAGPFEEANGGTIFLDEIGEIPLSMQPKLLRVLESGTVRRVGENTHRIVDARVVCATHRNLKKMVREGTFRGDLYHRLAVLELESPPLRERHGDLALLLRHTVGSELFGELTKAQWEAIETYEWEGNIRELRNFAQRAIVHGWGFGLFQASESPPPSAPSQPSPSTPPSPPARPSRRTDPHEGETLAEYRARCLDDCEQRYLRAALAWSSGNVTNAAKIAGVNRCHFHRILRQRGLSDKARRLDEA